MGRSRNTALILISQNAGDLLNEQVTNCMSSVFAFRSSERAEVANVMSLLGVEPSEEHKAVFAPSATANASSVTSTTARAASASISYPKNYGTGSTQIRHEPAGLSRRLPPPSKTAEYRSLPRWLNPTRALADQGSGRPARALLLASVIAAIVLSALLAGPLGVRRAGSPSRPPSPRRSPRAPGGPRRDGRAGGARLARPGASPEPADLADHGRRARAGICNVPGRRRHRRPDRPLQGGLGVLGDLNNICTPGPPQPELATAGINSMITTPGSPTTGKTLYDNYGIAGQYWAATGLHCSDMTSLIGNNVAGMVFDMAKSLDRVTITVYQSAAGADILGLAERRRSTS